MLPRLQFVRDICTAIKEARHFEAQERDQQALDLCQALAVRKAESDARVIALEAQCAALEARLNRLERGRRKKKPKLRKAAA